MNVQQATEIQQKLQKLLKDFAAENGLSIGGLGGQIVGPVINFKFKCSSTESSSDSNGNAVDPRFTDALIRHGYKFGLKEEHVHREVVLPGHGGTLLKCEFLGMSGYTKAAVKDKATGKVWLYKAETVAKQLNK